MEKKDLIPALQISSLNMTFGGLRAVAELDLILPQGIIYGLIGPNGAGKTTVFNMLTGVYQPTSGSIKAFGRSILGKKPYQVSQCGLARTFQNIRLFKDLTVLENLLIAADQSAVFHHYNIFNTVAMSRKILREEENKRAFCLDILSIFKLDHRAEAYAKNLPYGDQRRVEILRTLATGARILLLDEPAAGMNAQETKALMQTIQEIRSNFNVTILLIEHDMKLIMGICQRISVLDYGIKIAEGSPEEIQSHSDVIEAYLGKGIKHSA